MFGASLVVLAALGQSAPDEGPRLVQQLGSARFSEREAAAAELERLGRAALPALREARDRRDPEVRTRAAALVNRIEGALLTQPTMLRLDFDARPLNEVVKELGEQAGVRLALIPDNAPQWSQRKITLRAADPLPFWKALDRLCDAARLQYNVGVNALPGSREPALPLFDGVARSTSPVYDTGPFRVSLLTLHYQRDVNFPAAAATPAFRNPAPATPPHGEPVTTEQFYAQMQVAAEPRLSLGQTGPLRVLEAVDEKGQSLTGPANGSPFAQRSAGYFGMGAGSSLQLQAPLVRPEVPGKVIKRLRGVVPLHVSTRKPGPLTVSLEGANGRTFRNDDVAITVQDVRPLGQSRQTVVELAVRPVSGSPGPGGPPADFSMPRPDTFQQQLEFRDGQGRAMTWYQTGYDGEAGRITLQVNPQGLDAKSAPAELKFYSLARAATELSFEFHDLPLP